MTFEQPYNGRHWALSCLAALVLRRRSERRHNSVALLTRTIKIIFIFGILPDMVNHVNAGLSDIVNPWPAFLPLLAERRQLPLFGEKTLGAFRWIAKIAGLAAVTISNPAPSQPGNLAGACCYDAAPAFSLPSFVGG